MTKSLLVLWAGLGAFFTTATTYAAGPMGHYLLGQKTIENIRAGRYEAPAELHQLLRDAECRRAFNGGAVGPDVTEQATHYGKTAELAQRMLEDAQRSARDAASRQDEAAFKQARRNLAFAYGWYSHVATDLNVHPKVNAAAGDSYSHNTSAQKTIHAAQEAQLTAYLRQTIAKPGDKYDVYVPLEFLAKHTGVSVDTLRAGEIKLRAKVAAELFSAGKVTLSKEQLAKLWGTSVRGSLQDTATLIERPATMGNWDLDCGKLSTEEFEALRSAAMAANGGALPTTWGRDYLKWYERVKSLPTNQWRDSLREILAGGSSPGAAPPRSEPPPSSTFFWSRAPHLISIRLRGIGGFPIPMGLQLDPPPPALQWSGTSFRLKGSGKEGLSMVREYEISGTVSADQASLISLRVHVVNHYSQDFFVTEDYELRDVHRDTTGDFVTLGGVETIFAVRRASDVGPCLVRYLRESVREGKKTTEATSLLFEQTSRGPAIIVRFYPR